MYTTFTSLKIQFLNHQDIGVIASVMPLDANGEHINIMQIHPLEADKMQDEIKHAMEVIVGAKNAYFISL
jgi:hypothetical protein